MNGRAKTSAKTEETKRTKHFPKTDDPQAIRSPWDHILSLQRTIGNQTVERLIHGLSGGKRADVGPMAKQGEDAVAVTGSAPATSPGSANHQPSQGAPGQASMNSWRASNDLWYFNGEPHQEPLATQATLHAEGKPAGTFLWSVTEGKDKAELDGARGDGKHAVKTNDNRVQIKSKAGSEGSDDVKVRVSQLTDNGTPMGTYEGALGVRTPTSTRRRSESTTHYQIPPHAPTNFPVAGEGGGGIAAEEEETTSSGTAGSGPSAVPKSFKGQGTTHAPDATWGYETHVNYEVLDDKGSPIKGFEVNEKWSTGVVNDDAKADWRRGAAGGVNQPAASTFFDNIQGETKEHIPAPMNPQAPLGTKAVQHWGQEWYIGSTTPGKGTKVQTNTLQKYQDHGEHQDIKSPP